MDNAGRVWVGFTNSKETVFFYYYYYWAELGLVKDCLYLVGGYWAGFGFSLVGVGLYVKCRIFFFFWQGAGLYYYFFGLLDLFIIWVGLKLGLLDGLGLCFFFFFL